MRILKESLLCGVIITAMLMFMAWFAHMAKPTDDSFYAIMMIVILVATYVIGFKRAKHLTNKTQQS